LLLPRHILSVLAYFEYFDHPVTAEEVWKYCEIKTSPSIVKKELQRLVEQGLLVTAHGYFARPGFESSLEDRRKFEGLNRKLTSRAWLMVRFLSRIPFVRGIAISGSLSKEGAREDSDIDYFIVTAPNRVWLVKAFAIFIKKTLFLNSRKYLCVNYLLSEDKLSLEKHNRFQAIEAASIIPMYGKDVFERFFAENNWIEQFYPNFIPDCANCIKPRRGINKILEFILKGSLGTFLETRARTLFARHGNKRYGAIEKLKGYFNYSKNASMLFPNDFEASVLAHYEKEVEVLVRGELVEH